MELIEKQYRFQVLVAAEADASWLAFLPAAVVTHARASRLGLRLLSRLVAQQVNLAAAQGNDAPPAWLLDGSALLRQRALHIGVLALAPEIRKRVLRTQVILLQQAFGAQYDEALALPSRLLREAPPSLDALQGSADEARAFAEQLGFDLLHALLQAHPQAVQQRLDLMFPKQYSEQRLLPAEAVDLAAVQATIATLGWTASIQ